MLLNLLSSSSVYIEGNGGSYKSVEMISVERHVCKTLCSHACPYTSIWDERAKSHKSNLIFSRGSLDDLLLSPNKLSNVKALA